MGKYSALADYLRAQSSEEVPMTFAQIERLIGDELPASHRYRAWWSNNSFNSVMTKAWLAAGFESTNVNMKERKLVFRKIVGGREPLDDLSEASGRAAVSKRHPSYGALKGLVRMTPGVDLTEPADPEWANSLEK